MIPNSNKIITTELANISGSGNADDVVDVGEGKITRGAPITLPAGTGVGVAILPGVISSSAAKTSAFTS
jgi:hypothetical protein